MIRIDHLSCSALNLWRTSPGLWALRYLAGVRDRVPAFWRGSAVEAGLAALLHGESFDGALAIARRTYALNAEEAPAADGKEEQEALIEPMLSVLKDWTPPDDLAATQLRVEHRFDGIDVPVIGYVDFCFLDGTDVDLKTTERIPSAPRADHVRQVSFYRLARGRRGGVLYASAKRWEYFEVSDEMMQAAIADLVADARSLLTFLSRCRSHADAFAMLPIDWDHYAAPKQRIAIDQLLGA